MNRHTLDRQLQNFFFFHTYFLWLPQNRQKMFKKITKNVYYNITMNGFQKHCYIKMSLSSHHNFHELFEVYIENKLLYNFWYTSQFYTHTCRFILEHYTHSEMIKFICCANRYSWNFLVQFSQCILIGKIFMTNFLWLRNIVYPAPHLFMRAWELRGSQLHQELSALPGSTSTHTSNSELYSNMLSQVFF